MAEQDATSRLYFNDVAGFISLEIAVGLFICAIRLSPMLFLLGLLK